MIEAFKLLGEISLRGGDVVQRQLENIGNRVEKSHKGFGVMGLALKGAGVAVGGMATGLSVMGGALVKTGIGYNSMVENSTVAWTTLMGSQEKAKKQVQDIANFAAKTQFNTENVDAMAKYFHNAGYEGKALFDQLGRIADVSGAFNISADSAQELARQMSQVDQAGVAYTGDLDILQNQGVPIFKALAKEMGTNVAGVKKMASEGKITSEVYDKAFNSIADSVKGSADKQAQTFTGMLSTLGDEAGQFAGTMTASLFKNVEGFLKKAVDALGKMNEGFKKSGIRGALEAVMPKDVADKVIKAFNDIKDAFQWVIDNWKPLVVDLSTLAGAFVAFKVLTTINNALKAFKALMIAQETVTLGATIAQWALNSALFANPLLWVALAVGVLIGVIVLLWLNWDKVSKWFNTSWKAFKKWASDTWDGIKTSWNNAMDAISRKGHEIWEGIKSFLSGLWNGIKSTASSIWNSLKSTVSNVWDGIKSKTESVWNGIKSTATSTWNAIKNAIMTPINSAKDAVGRAVDWIKSKFSGLHISLPNIKVPSFSVKNWSNNPADWLKRMPSVQVSWHAEGGLVNRATLIGAGEAGAEAILPLQGRHMLPMAKAISDFLGQKDINRQTPTEVPIFINGRELARALIVDIDQEMQRRAVIRRRGV